MDVDYDIDRNMGDSGGVDESGLQDGGVLLVSILILDFLVHPGAFSCLDSQYISR